MMSTFSVCIVGVKCLSVVTYRVEATCAGWDINGVSSTDVPTCAFVLEISFCGGKSMVLVARGGILEMNKNKR